MSEWMKALCLRPAMFWQCAHTEFAVVPTANTPPHLHLHNLSRLRLHLRGEPCWFWSDRHGCPAGLQCLERHLRLPLRRESAKKELTGQGSQTIHLQVITGRTSAVHLQNTMSERSKATGSSWKSQRGTHPPTQRRRHLECVQKCSCVSQRGSVCALMQLLLHHANHTAPQWPGMKFIFSIFSVLHAPMGMELIY